MKEIKETPKEKTKRIDIKEFREFGYLQELNRRFLHPLGLALEVVIDKDGIEKLGGIWDYRDAEEGIRYEYNNKEFSSDERRSKARVKKLNIEYEIRKRKLLREKVLGYWEEPIK